MSLKGFSCVKYYGNFYKYDSNILNLFFLWACTHSTRYIILIEHAHEIKAVHFFIVLSLLCAVVLCKCPVPGGTETELCTMGRAFDQI